MSKSSQGNLTMMLTIVPTLIGGIWYISHTISNLEATQNYMNDRIDRVEKKVDFIIDRNTRKDGY